MSQNPYANPYPQQYNQPYPQGYGTGVPARTSAMAVISLVCSLICCIPGFSILGVLFGGLALLAIAMSGGKVKGVGLAISGLIIGIIVSVVMLGSFFFFLQVFGRFATTTATTITAFEQNDPATVRTTFVPSASAKITDERVSEFAAIVDSDLGTYDRVPDGIGDWWSAYSNVFSNPRMGQAMQTSQQRYANDVIPIPIKFDNGWHLIFVVIDQSNSSGAPPNGVPLYRDLGIVRADGSIEWLVSGNAGGGTALPQLPGRPGTNGSGNDPDPDTDPDADSGDEGGDEQPAPPPAPVGRRPKP